MISTLKSVKSHAIANPRAPILNTFVKMFLLKIKGTAKIPDYVQMRNDDFTLLAYFRADRPEKAILKAGYGDKEKELLKIITELPFGKVTKIEL